MLRRPLALVLISLALGHAPARAAAPQWPATWAQRPAAPARGVHGMASTIAPLATQVGVQVLRDGGNAVDAAVAIGFALAVTWPEAGNVGGGGFMVVRDPAGHAFALDYRETAPARASRDMFLDAEGAVRPGLSLDTRLGVGTPGTVRGLHEAHRRLGTRPWTSLVRPAIALARDGFVVNDALARSFARRAEALGRDPEARRIFQPQGRPLIKGERLVQPELARTLEAIALQGPDGFYQGAVGAAIARDMAAHQGLLGAADLAGYRAHWREPISFSYRGYRVLSMPPPSSGGVLLGQMLGMLEQDALGAMPYHGASMIHLITEVERRAYADRNAYLGDPDFVGNPVGALLDPGYLRARRASIDPERATPEFSRHPGLDECPQTTHFVVADQAGWAVSNTYTLNGAFGCAIVAPGTGVLYNNEMDDFAAKPGTPNLFGLVQGPRNAIAPGKRMLSSMSPTLVLDPRGRFYMAAGSPGGSTIPTTTLQVLLNVLDHGMNAFDAVSAPRFHHQGLPDEIVVEEGGFDPAVLQALEAQGHPLRTRRLGDAHAIVVAPDGHFEGGADPRNGGLALGY